MFSEMERIIFCSKWLWKGKQIISLQDNDLLVLNPFHGIKIIRPKDFEEILEDDEK
jgi:predicted nucleic acid-binding protein